MCLFGEQSEVARYAMLIYSDPLRRALRNRDHILGTTYYTVLGVGKTFDARYKPALTNIRYNVSGHRLPILWLRRHNMSRTPKIGWDDYVPILPSTKSANTSCQRFMKSSLQPPTANPHLSLTATGIPRYRFTNHMINAIKIRLSMTLTRYVHMLSLLQRTSYNHQGWGMRVRDFQQYTILFPKP